MFGWGKKKEVVPVKSGFVGDTSPQQDACLAEFKEWAVAKEMCSLDIYDDYDMLRFCRARKFVLKDIQDMFTEFMRWRKDEKIDDIIDDFDFSERD